MEAEGKGAAGADGGGIGRKRRLLEAEEGWVGADDGPFVAGGGVAGEFDDEAPAGIEGDGLAVLGGADGEGGVGVAAAADGEGEGKEQEGKNPFMHGEDSFLVFQNRFYASGAKVRQKNATKYGRSLGPERTGGKPPLEAKGPKMNASDRGGGIKTFRGERIC